MTGVRKVKQHGRQELNQKKFQTDLIRWYLSEQRELPWREDKDPYKIWVSEVMLQQTRVDTVIPYFHRFINQFPTLEALAQAEEESVLKAWEGLGYYSRARNLQAGVREVYEKYEARVPDEIKALSNLKGIGPYTAGAILSIAYGKAEPAVDGNVMRVMSRILMIEEDIAKPKTRKLFEEEVRKLIPDGNASEFNQGLMELGAVICTPKSPKCLICPVQSHCHAFSEGRQEEVPVKGKKKPPKLVRMAVAVVKNERDEYFIHRRPQSGLLAGLWEFPGFEVTRTDKSGQLTEKMFETYGVRPKWDQRMRNIQHIFTHLKWELAVYMGTMANIPEEREDIKWVSFDDLRKYPFPVSHQKIIAMIEQGREEK
ncbi:MAG TPA: A/G-specific adenine glycosylase [Bacillales bacterium]|nr:A/G-specific adenine glycosylase [Bacillales bacterium]